MSSQKYLLARLNSFMFTETLRHIFFFFYFVEIEAYINFHAANCMTPVCIPSTANHAVGVKRRL